MIIDLNKFKLQILFGIIFISGCSSISDDLDVDVIAKNEQIIVNWQDDSVIKNLIESNQIVLMVEYPAYQDTGVIGDSITPVSFNGFSQANQLIFNLPSTLRSQTRGPVCLALRYGTDTLPVRTSNDGTHETGHFFYSEWNNNIILMNNKKWNSWEKDAELTARDTNKAILNENLVQQNQNIQKFSTEMQKKRIFNTDI